MFGGNNFVSALIDTAAGNTPFDQKTFKDAVKHVKSQGENPENLVKDARKEIYRTKPFAEAKSMSIRLGRFLKKHKVISVVTMFVGSAIWCLSQNKSDKI